MMQRSAWLQLLVVVCDLIAVVAALFVAHGVWTWYHPHLERILQISWWELWLPNPFMPSGLVLPVAWVLVLRQTGLYTPERYASSARIAAGVSRASMVFIVMVVVLQFILPDRTYSRLLLLLVCGFSGGFILLSRMLLFQLQHHLPRDIAYQRIAVVGVGDDAAAMASRMERYGHRTYKVIGFIEPQEPNETPASTETERLGNTSELPQIVNTHDLQVIVIATHDIGREEAMRMAQQATQLGLRVLQVPFIWGFASPRISLTPMGDLQLVDLTTLTYPTLAEQLKRIIDVLLTLAGGVFLILPMLFVALLIKLQDGGPVLFVQARAGKGGRTFPFYKFRSMIVDAESRRAELQSRNESSGVLFKLTEDPRITPFGHFIRKYSIDELPQLLNVLRGDMNLVGPRPLPVGDLVGIAGDPEAEYWFELRSKVKPGITGIWQVSGRSNLGFQEMVQHDIDYVQSWSLWLDLVILLKTIPAVLRGRGAR